MNNDKQKVAYVIRACRSTSSSTNKINNTPFTNLESASPNLDFECIDDNHQLIADCNRNYINNNGDQQLIDDNLLQGFSKCKIDTPILSHYNLHHPMHGISSQNEGTKLEKNVDACKSKRKQHVNHERTCLANKDHAARRKVSKKRIKRQRREFSDRLQDLQNLMPHSHKKDHASILDDAAEYIKYLKLQNEMLELSEEGQLHQVPYIISTYIPEAIERNEPAACDLYNYNYNYKLVP